MHSLGATYQNQVRRHANIFENWDKVMKVSMRAIDNRVLFWGDNEELQACPKYKESRWEDANGSRWVPQKVLRHFPLISRL